MIISFRRFYLFQTWFRQLLLLVSKIHHRGLRVSRVPWYQPNPNYDQFFEQFFLLLNYFLRCSGINMEAFGRSLVISRFASLLSLLCYVSRTKCSNRFRKIFNSLFANSAFLVGALVHLLLLWSWLTFLVYAIFVHTLLLVWLMVVRAQPTLSWTKYPTV